MASISLKTPTGPTYSMVAEKGISWEFWTGKSNIQVSLIITQSKMVQYNTTKKTKVEQYSNTDLTKYTPYFTVRDG